MLFSTLLVGVVMLVAWGLHPLLVVAFLVLYVGIEGAFLSANLLNIPNGGWFSITMAAIIAAITGLHIWGTSAKAAARKRCVRAARYETHCPAALGI